MTDFVIFVESSCDLPALIAEQWDLKVLSLSLELQGHIYKNDLQESEISCKQLYQALREGAEAKTFSLNPEYYREAMESVLQEEKDILYLGFSSGLSGTFHAASLAIDDLRKKYPQRTILAVDTLCASMGQGYLAVLAAMERAKGKSVAEVCDFAEKIKLRLCHWFTVDDLHFLHRGGRLSRATAVVGQMLNIKPVMRMNDQGKLEKVSAVRGRKAALQALAEQMKKTVQTEATPFFYISHSDCEEDAKRLKEIVQKQYPEKKIYIGQIGPVIGSHSGPNTLALYFIGTTR